ncbi:MAG: T9SS type A sorting domain-containing protein [Mameliella sp.]|nr:T9SS type A sorting domain-containing protein [Phaeodactylibacter sp.]
MKKLYQSLAACCLFFFAVSPLMAQIPNDSPIPVDVFFEVPSTGLNRTIGDYTSMSNSTEWGTQPLRTTVTAEVMWVNDDDLAGDGLDTLGCDTTTMLDYTGKMILIRRGACFFSDKIYYAQQAGAIAAVIVNADGSDPTGGMAAGDEKALDITIPGIFINDPGEAAGFIEALDAGETVIGTFQVRGFFGELGPNNYGTPLSQVTPMDSIKVDLLNLDPESPLLDVSASVDIIAPDGSETKLTSVIDSIQPDEIHSFVFESFVPDQLGTYEMLYSNSLTEDTLMRQFEINEYTYQMDNGNIPEWPVDSWIAATTDGFVEDLLVYDFGNYYETGDAPSVATHATFSLGNPDSIRTGFSDADIFFLTLFDTDPDGDGQGATGLEIDYSTFETVGEAVYILNGNESPYELLTAAFPEPVQLKANGSYLLMVRYNGVNAATGIPPWYTYSGQESYPGLSTMTFTDQLYTGGWAGGFRAVVRLHLEGFNPVSIEDQLLSDNKAKVFPNPADETIQLELELEEYADEVRVVLVDLFGQVIERNVYEGIKGGTFTFNTTNLAPGTYFMAIQTPEGQATKRIVVIH